MSDELIAVIHGESVVVTASPTQAEIAYDNMFWDEVAAYSDAAWRGFIHREYEGLGLFTRGGGRVGFTFKTENHHPTLTNEHYCITTDELFGPDDGPFNPLEEWRYTA